jgi:hypothetical protein
MTSSGTAHDIAAPGAPDCLPRLRAARSAARRCLRGRPRPGRSSDEGGSDEFSLLRDSSRSSRATRSRNSAISASRAAQPAQPGPGGRSVTTDDHQSRPTVVKATRWADQDKIAMHPGRHAASANRLHQRTR